eukprot:7254073-Lingulodinium_polyedra.AAC.1
MGSCIHLAIQKGVALAWMLQPGYPWGLDWTACVPTHAPLNKLGVCLHIRGGQPNNTGNPPHS